jgi:hypothetical protein
LAVLRVEERRQRQENFSNFTGRGVGDRNSKFE